MNSDGVVRVLNRLLLASSKSLKVVSDSTIIIIVRVVLQYPFEGYLISFFQVSAAAIAITTLIVMLSIAVVDGGDVLVAVAATVIPLDLLFLSSSSRRVSLGVLLKHRGQSVLPATHSPLLSLSLRDSSQVHISSAILLCNNCLLGVVVVVFVSRNTQKKIE